MDILLDEYKPVLKTERTLSLPGFSQLLLFSSVSILFGVLWDISWHMSIGRDTLLSPPHIAIYLGGIIAGIASIIKTIHLSFFSTAIEKENTIRFWGLRAPLSAMFCIWGAGAMLTSAPFDDWWHNAYGLDVKILSPPHSLLAIGILSIQMGSMVSILAIQNNRKDLGWWKHIYILSAGILLSITYIFIIEFMSRSRMHHPLFYQVAGGAIPLMLFAGSTAARVKYPATKIAFAYMAIFMLALWISPLFPAEPKLSPVRNPVDHFVPLPFPLLLFIPAFFVDLVHAKFKQFNFWTKTWVTAGIFLTFLFITQYSFAEFLISPASRNWFFGTHEWAYYVDPAAPYRYAFVPFKGSQGGFLLSMFVAFILTFISTALGFKWGNWMKHILR